MTFKNNWFCKSAQACKTHYLINDSFMVCLALEVTYAGDWLDGTGASWCVTTQMRLFITRYLLVEFPGMQSFSWSWMVLLLCTNYTTVLVRKKDAHTQFSFSLALRVPFFVCWMFAPGGKRSTPQITQPTASVLMVSVDLNNQPTGQVLALCHCSTPEVNPRGDTVTLLALSSFF